MSKSKLLNVSGILFHNACCPDSVLLLSKKAAFQGAMTKLSYFYNNMVGWFVVLLALLQLSAMDVVCVIAADIIKGKG